ncbi:NUDIX domain-containing protein [Psychrobacter sp. AOP22-C1-22]|uniref:NUDIX domain-containing protein n=1 Tax=unclassified Psychrobacter TaxID=196806 RepID=UPI0017882837|nr:MULTISPECIES: NUDIX domain-containing protein [unclassified Psychrobacter]MBE0405397.1 NUDIX domain-containing protein [Psychrobacter sp. FME6]MBE0444323.1 NUDIX domain-containing protein [Psychrobacter sp. FME5]MDN5801366.1 NUDIX domain-containing protein [Psychrobacter sp.]MDN5891150.1 NUDIX domain-containing protein [Psychrobacter sp.]
MSSQSVNPAKKQAENQATNEKATIVNVAVAVIHYKEQYLLGFRNAAQHQGNRYEFVGGKIDANESAEQALIREVAEETGMAISGNTIVKLGRLHHDYGDKQVSLQVYITELTTLQYEKYKYCQHGLEGQALTWVNKDELLAGQYSLPAANKTILKWLALPTQIAITYPLAHFNAHPNPELAWLQYHQQNVAPESWLYIRVKETCADSIAARLIEARPDIHVIVPCAVDSQPLDVKALPVAQEMAVNSQPINQITDRIVAHHLTHQALMQCFNNNDEFVSSPLLSQDFPLIVSCHDATSIDAANQLANTRLQQQLPPVIGAFLSPVLATQTHPDATPLGWESWSALAQLADMPIIGLGGLSPMMIDQALQYGGVSIAGIRQFL